jgi:hypothetical protein
MLLTLSFLLVLMSAPFWGLSFLVKSAFVSERVLSLICGTALVANAGAIWYIYFY